MSAPDGAPAGAGWLDPRSYWLLAALLVTAGLAFTALLAFQGDAIGELNLSAGSVAPQDIQAPFSLTYQSEILTQRQRDAAVSAVTPVYTTPDTQVARDQLEALRATLTFITTVRADQFATLEEKYADLILLLDATFPPETATAILKLSTEQWQTIQQEALLVLQQVQRGAIRPEQVDDALRSIPSLVNLSLPETQANIVVTLVGLYVAPNSFFSEDLTAAKRQEAADAVPAVEEHFVAGELIVARGRVLTEEHIEALQQFGLLETGSNNLVTIKAGILLALAAAIASLYLYSAREILQNVRQVVFVCAAFLIFLYAGRILAIGHVVIPFAFPTAAFGLLLASLFSTLPGLMLPISLSLLLTFGMPNALELTLYYFLTTIFAVLMLGRSQRIIAFFWAGIGAASVGAAIVAASRMLDPNTDLTGLTTLIGAAFVYGLASSGLAILLQFVSAKWLGKTTNLQLVELTRPEHPLLRYTLLNAPGTYQHSLQVANLAELAAERIGADPLLTRVGALYHDAGKACNPQYFIENQIPGTPNLHDALTPLESARIIIRHVTDGAQLAREHRLPQPITRFILEHHGTTLTRYQYVRAVNEAGGDKSLVDAAAFTYPGPRPHSRETALVMLADGCEARARSERPPTEYALRNLIKETVDNRIAEHQLDEVNLTPRDINAIIEVFLSTLKGVHHPRIEYPKMDSNRTVPLPERSPALKDKTLRTPQPAPADLPALQDD
jgi:hypothetical protein